MRLGEGEKTFQAAKTALGNWEHFQLGWVEAVPRESLIRAGAVVAVVARVFGVWWLNACRIVYEVNEDGPIRRFGFAYGILPGHAERGEERFVVEWDRGTGGVWYDVLAFSRPIFYWLVLLIRSLAERRSDSPAIRSLRCFGPCSRRS
jgi:uncharacterized protein (UPF0548 family)